MTKKVYEMPKILYKYRDYKNTFNRRTLFELELFLATTSMFNDPYEGSIPFIYDPIDLTPENIFLKMRQLAIMEHPNWKEAEIQKYCFEGQSKNLLNDDKHIEQFNEQNRKDIDNTFGIFSMTIHPLNYLMWSHYGNSHTGFCLGFDSAILYETVGGSLGPVHYDTEVPKLRLFGDIYDFHLKQLATKSEIWKYEDEYRIVKSNAARQIITYPKEMIKQIYLGFKMSLSQKYKIIDFAKTNNIDCQIFEISLDKTTFKLNNLRIY
ncbi:MAG: DUF2971 domain-containing protein [Bacteroidetes bacterium]|nr:DUF2971 domain-containing protein [Bacteroidota bacterium]